MEPTRTPDRNEAIRLIRSALRRRSGRSWSVRGGRGTSWGWIEIDVPPSREANRDAELKTLAGLLGLDAAHHQGVLVAASGAHRREYIARAEGRTPVETAQPYWD